MIRMLPNNLATTWLIERNYSRTFRNWECYIGNDPMCDGSYLNHIFIYYRVHREEQVIEIMDYWHSARREPFI